jgi:hypothetical protein
LFVSFELGELLQVLVASFLKSNARRFQGHHAELKRLLDVLHLVWSEQSAAGCGVGWGSGILGTLLREGRGSDCRCQADQNETTIHGELLLVRDRLIQAAKPPSQMNLKETGVVSA